MTTNPLDLIHARSLAGTGAHTRADNLALVAALWAVESVCRNLWAESIEGNAIIRESGLTQDAVLRVRAAIREALG